MGQIAYTPDVKEYLIKLTYKLYKQEYFSYLENAFAYVDRLRDDIEKYIDIKQHKLTPRSLSKYGRYYANFKANKRTVWYVIFDHADDIYNINYITNNHVGKAKELYDLC